MTAVEMFLLGFASDLRAIGREVQTINLTKGTMTFFNPERRIKTHVRAKYDRQGRLVVLEKAVNL